MVNHDSDAKTVSRYLEVKECLHSLGFKLQVMKEFGGLFNISNKEFSDNYDTLDKVEAVARVLGIVKNRPQIIAGD
jgi:hypothetical protein